MIPIYISQDNKNQITMENSTDKENKRQHSTLNLPDTLKNHFFEEFSGLNVFTCDCLSPTFIILHINTGVLSVMLQDINYKSEN